jgi:hypothetical protein
MTAMKLEFVLVWGAVALAVAGHDREGLSQTVTSPQESRAGQTQNATILWQFDTHG